MSAPENIKLIEGEIASYYLDKDGILVAYSKSVKRTVENIGGNIALVKQITGSKKVPLLIHLANSPVPDKATREFSARQLPNIYTAMAMISKPGLARLVINMVFMFKQPTIPMKNFTDQNEAREWLKQFL